MKGLTKKQKQVLDLIDKKYKMFKRKTLLDELGRNHITKLQSVLEILYKKGYLKYIGKNMWMRTEAKISIQEELERLRLIEKEYNKIVDGVRKMGKLLPNNPTNDK